MFAVRGTGRIRHDSDQCRVAPSLDEAQCRARVVACLGRSRRFQRLRLLRDERRLTIEDRRQALGSGRPGGEAGMPRLQEGGRRYDRVVCLRSHRGIRPVPGYRRPGACRTARDAPIRRRRRRRRRRRADVCVGATAPRPPPHPAGADRRTRGRRPNPLPSRSPPGTPEASETTANAAPTAADRRSPRRVAAEATHPARPTIVRAGSPSKKVIAAATKRQRPAPRPSAPMRARHGCTPPLHPGTARYSAAGRPWRFRRAARRLPARSAQRDRFR